jgi:predicted Zn-dependent peptidase
VRVVGDDILTPMNIKTHTLNNNLKVINVDTGSFPTVTTMLLVKAGSRYETVNNNGVAHFFEHMAFKGSKKYKTAFDISSKIDGIGGVFNAFTSKDHTGYYIKAPISHTDLVLDILSDMLLHSNLLKEEINREKQVIIEEINMYEDMPARKVSDVYDELVYDGNPLAYDIAGTKDTVSSITRKTITDYMDQLYFPENAVLIIAGGIGASKFSFEKWEDWGNSSINSKSFKKYESGQSKKAVKVLNKKTEQAHFCLGYRMFSQHDKRRYALSVLSTILGGGMSSRLFIEVRERRGLCYYVSTGRDLYEDTGTLVTQAGVTNNKHKLNEAIKVIIDEHEKIASGSLKEEELQRAKELIKGRLLISLEDSQTVAAFEGTKYLFEKNVIKPEDVLSEIDNVTSDQVKKIATEFIVSRGLNIAVIGPYHEEDILI